MDHVSNNFWCPGGWVLEPNPGSSEDSMIPDPPSQNHKLTDWEILYWYDAYGLTITSANMKWNPVINNFSQKCEVLVEQNKGENIDAPKISLT